MSPTIIFLRVYDSKSKLMRLCTTIHQNFAQGKKIIIQTPSSEASQYLDDFLWNTPIDSFLPHEVSEQFTRIPVVITQKRENLNEAQILINLCSHIHPNPSSFQKIYELWDLTNPLKEEESRQRKMNYEERKLPFYIEE